jgi:membrane protein implicated in regulation of membrane protease activity
MGYNSIAWLPLTAGLTAIGMILSYYAYRRRGLRSALRWAAVSLLPIAAYLTGSIAMFWKIGTAIGDFATGFVFSPMKWAGVGVAGLAVVLYLAGGGRERRKAAREARKAARDGQRAEAGKSPSGAPGSLEAGDATRTLPTSRLPEPVSAPAKKPAKAGKTAAPADDDMKDIEEILRKRGL